jgi:hypothetical protein
MVVFSADKATAKAVANWRRHLRLPPLHVTSEHVNDAINPADLTIERLRQYLLATATRVAKLKKHLDLQQHLEALASWKSITRSPSSIHFHSHNVTRPNEMVLIAAGEEEAKGADGHLNVSSPEDYVRGITDSAEAVMRLWKRTEDRPVYALAPPRPDLFLIAPAMYRGAPKRFERAVKNPSAIQALRALDRQRGYTMELNLDKDQIDHIGPILAMRGAEIKLLTTAIGLRTASTLAATVRLPPVVNRSSGVVDQLARFMRTHENPPAVKAARVFKAVQDALVASIPEGHIRLINRSKTGIKIIADAPLEWLPIDGLPLGVRHDVSRINATPGNLFLEQIRPPITQFMRPDFFRQYLVLSMFDEGDRIAHHLRAGMKLTTDGDNKPIVGQFAAPKTVEDFKRAINEFEGPILIVDSHGIHASGDSAGGLVIGGKPCDVWGLAGQMQMPPIVILSACDTHPFDRSHATVANGFLACGATAVVATSLPIRATSAARFVIRVINRAVHFGGIMNGMGRTLPWTNVIGGVLRMELATDIIRSFREKAYFSSEQESDLLLETNMDLNPFRPDWYERLSERLIAACKISTAVWEVSASEAIAGSDAIRYLHLGNPESIIVADERVTAKLAALSGLALNQS